ncbi:MAG: hypothetical protein FWG64_01855 [Firmicutes bacterium]|nr:hypothetical protein [Bacillota bacterium]
MAVPVIAVGVGIGLSSLLGLGAGIVGASDLSDAKEMVNNAESRYNKKKAEFERANKRSQKISEEYAALKLEIWSKDFDRFTKTYKKIKNPPNRTGNLAVDGYKITTDDLREIEGISITALDVLGGLVGSGVAAAAVPGIAYGGALLFGTASTGTAISTLAGAAATKAALAFLGGGSLAAGGAGIAGGLTLLGGLAAGPAVLVGGFLLAAKGSDSLDKARDIRDEVDKAVEKFGTAMEFLAKVDGFVEKIQQSVLNAREFFTEKMGKLERTVIYKQDYNQFSEAERKNLHDTYLSLQVIKNMLAIVIVEQKETANESNPVFSETAEKTLTHLQTLNPRFFQGKLEPWEQEWQ